MFGPYLVFFDENVRSIPILQLLTLLMLRTQMFDIHLSPLSLSSYLCDAYFKLPSGEDRTYL